MLVRSHWSSFEVQNLRRWNSVVEQHKNQILPHLNICYYTEI